MNVTLRVDDAFSGEVRGAVVVPAALVADKLTTVHRLAARLGTRLVVGVVCETVVRQSCLTLDEVVMALCDL